MGLQIIKGWVLSVREIRISPLKLSHINTPKTFKLNPPISLLLLNIIWSLPKRLPHSSGRLPIPATQTKSLFTTHFQHFWLKMKSKIQENKNKTKKKKKKKKPNEPNKQTKTRNERQSLAPNQYGAISSNPLYGNL